MPLIIEVFPTYFTLVCNVMGSTLSPSMSNSKLVEHAAVHVRWEETVEGEQFEGAIERWRCWGWLFEKWLRSTWSIVLHQNCECCQETGYQEQVHL